MFRTSPVPSVAQPSTASTLTTTTPPRAPTTTSTTAAGATSSIHYIEQSLSRAAAANPQPTVAQPGHRRRSRSYPGQRPISPPRYGYSGSAPPPGMYVRALYDYEVDDRTSLSFRVGDLIQVLNQLETGWWDGVLRGVRGWFPSNYCALVTDPNDPALAHPPVAGPGLDTDVELDDDDDEDDEDDDDEDDDDDDEDDRDLDPESEHDRDEDEHAADASPRLPLEGTDPSRQEEAAYWIPQATPDGQLFYFNTLTCRTTLELPLETPTSAGETGPVHAHQVSLPSMTHVTLPRGSPAVGHPDDEASIDGNSVSEIEAEPRAWSSRRAAPRARHGSEVSNGISPATSLDSIHGFPPYPTGITSMPAPSARSGPTAAGHAATATALRFFEDGTAAPMTWSRLVDNMRRAVEGYRQAIDNGDRSAYVKRADDISDHLRLLLTAGSGTTDNHSGQPSIILTNKALYPHFRDMMSKFSKLVLSSHIAAADWPTPESYAKCLHEAAGVLQGVSGYMDVARQQRGEDIPRLVPGFVLAARAGGGWHNHGLAASARLRALRLERGDDDDDDDDDDDGAPTAPLDGRVLTRLEDLKRLATVHLRRLDEQLVIQEKIVTAQRQEMLGDAICAAAGPVLEAARSWMAIVESLSLAAFGSTTQHPQVVDFFRQKQRLYDLVAELVVRCQAVTAPLADEWAERRGDPLDERLQHVATASGQLESCLGQLFGSLQYLDELMPASVGPLGPRPHGYSVGNGPSGGGGDVAPWRPRGPSDASSGSDYAYELDRYPHDGALRKHPGARNKAEIVLGELLDPLPAPRPTADMPQEYLRLDLEGELVFDDKVDPPQVKGGTLAALVEQLTRHDKLDADFNHTFLLTYRSFTTAAELFDLLVQRFSIQPPPGLASHHYQAWVDVKQMPIRLRVVNILKSWFSHYWMEGQDVASQARLRQAYDFAEQSITTSNTPGAAPLMAVLDQRLRGLDMHNRELVRNPNVAMPPPILPKSLRKLKFLDIDVVEFARQLTLLEAQLYVRIKPTECLLKTWNDRSAKESPETHANLRALILHSNRLTNWVAEMIVTQAEVKKRVLVIKHFIQVADRCRSMHNFSTLTAIISGLGASPISRLTRTWNQLKQSTKDTLESMRQLMDGKKNFSLYRDTLHAAVPPCIPFFGGYLTDLRFIEDGMPSNLKKTSLINFMKRAKTAEVIRDIQQYQNVPYPFQAVPELQEYMLTNMKNAKDVQEMYERSLLIEPKEREDEKIAR
ncbi:MAG: hypothetical protein M1826_004638 [Phylliscum demangeonii]|nr:MAG: hypothetical protein M1826_004638 [Phylliscum demangeonii]